MTRTSFAGWPCTIARTVDVIGDSWTLLILRESFFFDARRFAEFQEWLGIPTNVLTARLKQLVAAGVLARHEAPAGRSSHEYRPTVKGAELWPVISAISAWGNRWVTDDRLEEIPLQHRACGAQVHHDRCPRCGIRPSLDEVGFEGGALRTVFADLLVRFAREDFGTARDADRVLLALRKLERSGCMDAEELQRLLAARRLNSDARGRIAALLDAG